MKPSRNKILVTFSIITTMALIGFIVKEFTHPKKTTVAIEVSPKGYVIFLDDIRQSSPILELKQGTYKLRIERYLHETWQQTLNIKSTEIKHLIIKLKPITAKVFFTSEPLGAEVYIDGEFNGITNLLKNLFLRESKYDFLIKKEGYKYHFETIKIENMSTKLVNIKLEKLTKTFSKNSVCEGEKCQIAGAIKKDPVTEMKFVLIKGGSFDMRTQFWKTAYFSKGEEMESKSPETPKRIVTVSDFWLGQHEVTQGQWKKIMGNNPSHFQLGNNYPVENVSYNNIQTFIAKLNAKGPNKYRLPTEAEWEFACREGGKKLKMLDSEANWENPPEHYYHNTRKDTTFIVGSFNPNSFGLYDMSENVEELVLDWYSESYTNLPTNNPKGASTGKYRVARHGSWDELKALCAGIASVDPKNGHLTVGFRLLLIK